MAAAINGLLIVIKKRKNFRKPATVTSLEIVTEVIFV